MKPFKLTSGGKVAEESSPTFHQDIISNENTHLRIVSDINNLVTLFHGVNKEAGWWDKTKEQKRAMELSDLLVAESKEGASDAVIEAIGLLHKVGSKERCPYTMQVLIISEVIEMMEGVRKNLMDDKLPEYKMEAVEMADIFLRIVDYCGGRNLNLGEMVVKKAKFNITRKDHSAEARAGEHGKQV